MNNIKGIYFNNGIQAAAKIIKEEDGYIHVENMLGIELTFKDEDPAKPMVKFQDMVIFADIQKTGLDTKLSTASVMFLYPLERDLEKGYVTRTSLIALAP